MRRKGYNRIIKTLIILLITVVLLPSCKGLIGIEKRKHLSGYNIDISKDITKEKTVKKIQYIIDTVGEKAVFTALKKALTAKKQDVDQLYTSNEDYPILEDCQLVASSDDELFVIDKENLKKLFTNPIPPDDPEDEEEDIDDTTAYINLALDILAILSILLGIILSIIGLSVGFLYIAFLVFSILAFGFSIYNIFKLKNRKKLIKDNVLYSFAIWLGIILFAFVLVFALLGLLILILQSLFMGIVP